MTSRSPRQGCWLHVLGVALIAAGAVPTRAGAEEAAPPPSPSSDSATKQAQGNELSVGGATISVTLGDARFTAGSSVILEWIRRSASIVSSYYSHFPTHTLRIEVEPRSGDHVNGGTTWGWGGGFIRVQVGRDVTDEILRNDWVLVHEMVHLALPDVGEDHSWLSEGLATYVEGIARVQAGNRREADVWAETARMMPKGLPEDGDRGLDNTHTWGRTYWGGAMFCLLADVEIRKRTEGRKGLQDALRAIADESGGLRTDWPIERVFRAGDAAVGTPALEDLYAKMKGDPMRPDLDALWTSLGVERDGPNVRLRDDAPLSAVRRAIMQPPQKAAEE
jgi:hypothetical protein